MSGISTEVKSFIPLPTGATAVYAPGGLQYYRHADWLGSSRFSSTPVTRTMYNDLAYAPFGETYAATGSTGARDISFAGNDEDTVTSLYDAQFREYGIQGRWPSPDPAGIAAANPANPQSWNRYAYVLNNPLALTDPTGKAAGLRPEYYEYNIDVLFMSGDVIGAAEAVGGGAIAGCDEFDMIDPNSFCNQFTLNWINPNWSPFGYQYTGPASGGKTVTFDTWDQYADWRTSDPCIYLNDSATKVEYTDYNSSPEECGSHGGTWVPPAFTWRVDPTLGKVVLTGLTPQACNQMNQGLNRMTYILTGGGVTVNPYIGAGIFIGMAYTNSYLNNRLCGGPPPW